MGLEDQSKGLSNSGGREKNLPHSKPVLPSISYLTISDSLLWVNIAHGRCGTTSYTYSRPNGRLDPISISL